MSMSHFCRLPGKIPTLQYPLAFLVHLSFFFWQKSGITFPLSHPFAIAKAFQRCKRTSQQKENHNGPHSGLIPYCNRKMSFLQWHAYELIWILIFSMLYSIQYRWVHLNVLHYCCSVQQRAYFRAHFCSAVSRVQLLSCSALYWIIS